MAKIKLQIKSTWGRVLFEYEKEDNTIKETVEEAIRQRANLSYANLRDANLSAANLRDADLNYADLRYANLSAADLSYANLSAADLNYANLRDANLSYANLRDANLSAVLANESTAMFFSQCPTEGSFIAWKTAEGRIVKLRVTEDAKRSSSTSLKSRCSKAEVLEIQEADGSKSDLKEVDSNHDSSFIYRIGEIVEVTDFDEDRWNECSTGIHFFIDREMAVRYL